MLLCMLLCAAFQISRQVKGHEGSVFCMCEMRSGTFLTGGGKDRKIIQWEHELRAERDIEVKYLFKVFPQKLDPGCSSPTHFLVFSYTRASGEAQS